MEEELGLAMPAFMDPSDNADIPESELENILDDDLLERADSTDLLNWTIDERTFAVHDGRAVGGEQWITPGNFIDENTSKIKYSLFANTKADILS